MFETDRVVELAARRAVRIAFGSVLIAGAAGVVANELYGRPVMPALLVPLIWACAVIAGAWVRMFGTRPLSVERAQRRFEPSIVLPSVGVALMLPLTLHLPIVLYTSGAAFYGDWVKLSLIVTGPTHVVLAALVGYRATQLVNGTRPLGIAAIWGICVGASCVPFAVLLLIPPALVALTGIAFIPALVYQQQLVNRERDELPDVFVPRAIVVA